VCWYGAQCWCDVFNVVAVGAALFVVLLLPGVLRVPMRRPCRVIMIMPWSASPAPLPPHLCTQPLPPVLQCIEIKARVTHHVIAVGSVSAVQATYVKCVGQAKRLMGIERC
jgi:hypothetical protein